MAINACATLGDNTGKPSCDVRMGKPSYPMPTRAKIFTANDLLSSATLKAAMRTAMLQASGSSDKIFAFPKMRVITDNTADPNAANLADGYEEILNESLPLYQLESTVGVCVNQAMVNFNGWNDKSFIVDDKLIFWFRKTANGGGEGFTIGNLYTTAPRFGNSSAINTVKTRLLFGDLEEFKYGLGALKLDFDPSKLVNLVNIALVEKDPQSTNVFTLGGIAECDGTDIFGAYSAGLANVARWVVKRLDTGVTITLTSVAADSVKAGWDITLDSTIYTALPSGTPLEFALAAPSVLDAAGVSGIEGLSKIYVKP